MLKTMAIVLALIALSVAPVLADNETDTVHKNPTSDSRPVQGL